MEIKLAKKMTSTSTSILNRIVYGDMNPLSTVEKRELHYRLSEVIQDAEYYCNDINPIKIQNSDESKARYFSYNELLNTTLINTENELKQKVANCNGNELEIENIVRAHQLEFTDIINGIETLYLFTEDRNAAYVINNEESSLDIFKITHYTLSKLLFSLEKNYNKYIDHSLTIPRHTMLSFIDSYKKLIAEISQKIQSLELPYNLDIILSETIDHFLYIHQGKANYYDKTYHLKLLNNAIDLINDKSFSINKCYIFLINLEVNCGLAFSFTKKFINDTIDKLNNSKKKIEELSNRLKQLQAIPKTGAISLHKNESLLTGQLETWILEKIESIQKEESQLETS